MEYITKYRPLLQKELEAFLSSKYQDKDQSIGWLNDFLDRLRPFMVKGKLIRGSLVCYSYKISSGQAPTKKVIKAAMAIELAHAALLIQDDIMDQDDYRRGQDALHYQYRKQAQAKKMPDAARFGENLAICASDMALFLANELLAQSSSDQTTLNNLQSYFSRILLTVCEGQMQDISLEQSSLEPSKAEIFAVMDAKTASYSLSLPLGMGAILGQAPPKTRKALESIGQDIGIIFQIRDDELGTLGDSQKIGKPVGNDIKKGKKTLLRYYLFKKCSVQEKSKLKAIFGNPDASKKDISYVRKLIAGYGVADDLAKEVDKLQRSAFGLIDQTGFTPEAREELKQLVRFCSSRKL